MGQYKPKNTINSLIKLHTFYLCKPDLLAYYELKK